MIYVGLWFKKDYLLVIMWRIVRMLLYDCVIFFLVVFSYIVKKVIGY